MKFDDVTYLAVNFINGVLKVTKDLNTLKYNQTLLILHFVISRDPLNGFL